MSWVYNKRLDKIVEKYGPEDETDRNRPWVTAVISDTMDPLVNHANNKIYDSKHRFREATKAAGCIEKGNDRVKPRPQGIDNPSEDVAKAVNMLRNGYKPHIQPAWDGD